MQMLNDIWAPKAFFVIVATKYLRPLDNLIYKGFFSLCGWDWDGRVKKTQLEIQKKKKRQTKQKMRIKKTHRRNQQD